LIGTGQKRLGARTKKISVGNSTGVGVGVGNSTGVGGGAKSILPETLLCVFTSPDSCTILHFAQTISPAFRRDLANCVVVYRAFRRRVLR
jgi:uncharacterized protein (UPF0254 family)